MAAQRPTETGGSKAQKARGMTKAEKQWVRRRRMQLKARETRRFKLGASIPRTTPEFYYPETKVLEAGFPGVNDPEFVEALGKLNEARLLNSEHARRLAIWLVLTGWQLKRAQQAREALHRRMNETGLPVGERDAIRAGCRRELIAWNLYETRAKKEYVQAVGAWQELTGEKRRKQRTPSPEERIQHLLPYTPAYPPVRTRVDAWRETFIRQALLHHFRTGGTEKALAKRGIPVPVMN